MGDRRPVPRAFRRQRRYDDYAAHGASVRTRLLELRDRPRAPVFGVNPGLVLVLQFDERPAESAYRPAGLLLLDDSDPSGVIVQAQEPTLALFLGRVDRYRAGIPAGQDRESLPLEAFFDALVGVDEYGPDHRVGPRLREELLQAPGGDELRLDVRCWHTGDFDAPREDLNIVTAAVNALGGQVRDTFLNHAAALVLARVYLPASAVGALAELPQIARIESLPRPVLAISTLFGADLAELPASQPPRATAPVVGLIDSGVRAGHPLLTQAIAGVEAAVVNGAALFPTGDDESEDGHGTRIAGLLIHGPLPSALSQDPMPPSLCRVFAVRVLDHHKRFPDPQLVATIVDAAVRRCAANGAQIVNLAIGDTDTRFVGPRTTPIAALVDALARELHIVIVVPTGNVHPLEYANDIDFDFVARYPEQLAASEAATLIDPAPASLGLTVGSVCADTGAGGLFAREAAAIQRVGKDGWPSPFTRHGPGVGGAIKPEFVAPGGTWGWDPDSQLVDDPELAIVSTSARIPRRLLDTNIGTSYAVPLVARAGAAILERYPHFGPNLVRALLLQSAQPTSFVNALRGTTGQRESAARSLNGYGLVRQAEAVSSSDHRVVLYREDQIPVDGVHLYELPLPTSFFDPGGVREIVIALAYDPPVRGNRLGYLGSRMRFTLYRGLTLATVRDILVRSNTDEIEELLGESAEDGVDAPAEDDIQADETDRTEALEDDMLPLTLGERLALLRRHEVTLAPASRKAGTNQLGRRTFQRALARDRYGADLVLAIKNTNQWADAQDVQAYALVAALVRDEDSAPIYAEIEQRVQVRVVLEVNAT